MSTCGWYPEDVRGWRPEIRRDLLVLILALGSCLAGCGSRPSSVSLSGPSPLPPGEWPLNSRISLPVTIDGRTAVMGLDSGAPIQCLFNPQKYGLDVDPAMTDSSVLPHNLGGLKYTTGADLGMLGHIYPKIHFAISDLPDPHYDGLLPWNILHQVVTELDWSDWRFTIHKGPPSAHDGWQRFAIDPLASRLWMIVPMPEGPPLRIALDTGDPSSAYVDTATWRRIRDPARETCRLVIDSYELRSDEECCLHTLSFGSLILHDLPVSESYPIDEEQRDHPVRLGLFAMRQFDMIIDGPNSCLYLRRSRRPPERLRLNNLGAVFPPSPNGDLVAYVIAGTPAARAGLQDGDDLLEMGDLRTDTHPPRISDLLFAIGAMSRQPAGTVLHLRVRRGHDLLALDVTLKDMLPSGGTGTAVP